ncbi:type I polyketide synthase [Argonema antarcticum]|uniref:type I polyketide synthase n=1 Tax=Argonema antarcticum TaxID=2942763 RepID=UPI0020115E67|nr:type I polyketide synthase [Argonema antarcticum]MCL1471384.1 SDR family oxidoreductase [Argonema antarcticum A004/B2]
MSEVHLQNEMNGAEIAIIGMAGRFPGAKDINVFWQNLREGVESVEFYSDEELLSSGVDSTLLNKPNYVKANPVLSDVEGFDAEFFGLSPKEAEILDPQHRLFIESAWEALENAGYNSETYQGSIGVYAGSETNTYLLNNIYPNFGLSDLPTLLGNDKDYLSSRVSYKLNLKGPSVSIQTACSTSLVAIHIACQSLLNGECDISLAGGVAVRVPQKVGYLSQEGFASPDGHCRSFDAKAQGSIFGSGVGVVVLKRLDDAIADGDSIHAIIKGSAINNDGALKAGYTAPSPDGQSAVISEAQAIAGIEPETINYIEAHGSGTPLGDPIEIAALTQVFQSRTTQKSFCAVGSVKTNFGHLGAAAGVAGLIKTVLAIKHQLIPPSLHFEQPNSKIDFANSPFYVNTKLLQWETHQNPRRAGVSSLGIGGTNAHVILEEAPPAQTSETSRPWQLLMLSAKTDTALETATANLAEHLKQHPDLNLADVAYTLQVGRRSFEHRRTVVCKDIQDAIAALQNPKRILNNIQDGIERPVAFMFTGLGTQYVNMAWELYQVEPTFQETVDRCCQFLKPLLGLDLRDVMYRDRNDPKTASQSGFDLRKMLGRGEPQADETTQKLNQTCLTQPAIFVIEYALAQLWISWGIHPVATIGYSIGEYVAATLAEVLSLEDALTLVAKRAQMIQELPNGAMLAVPLGEEKVRPLLNKNLSLSAINGSAFCVVAGTTNAVDELAAQLTEKGLACRRLQSSHAFHSQMMEAIAESFTELVKTVNLQAPKIPYLSNVTGTWITAEQATDPNYWTKHLCQPVLFADGMQELWKKHKPILLEVGPGQTLCSLGLQCLENVAIADKVALPSLRDAYNQQSDLAFLFNTLGQLWLSGVKIDWSRLYTRDRHHRIPLPTYPFDRQRYWIEAPKNTPNLPIVRKDLEQKLDISDWFYIPSWKQSPLSISLQTEKLIAHKQSWLVFIDRCGVGSQLVERLDRENQDVIVVKVGEQFDKIGDREYAINPEKKEDYDTLLNEIQKLGEFPQIIAHLWNVTPSDRISTRLDNFDEFQKLGFYSLLFLAKALGESNLTDSLQLCVISNDMQEVFDEEELYPEKATSLGICKVISQEYSNLTCRSIDITLPGRETRKWQQLINQLLVELTAETPDRVIAYRGNHRWVQDFKTLPMKAQTIPTVRLRKGGVYVITGGLGKLGLIVAEYLAKTAQAKLVLIGRSELPSKAEWQHDEQNRLKVEKVKFLEELGAEILTIKADVSNFEQMQAMVNQVRDRFGKINGVIHAAGTASASFIQQKNPETAKSVFAPKVKGTLVINEVLKDEKLEFLVLFSSISSIVGGLGQADYCAASAFLDAFAHYNFFRREMLTVSINWDGWQENNLQDEWLSTLTPEVQAEIKQAREKYSITSQEGVKALDYILSSTFPQVIVSTRNLQAVIEHDQLSTLADVLENLKNFRTKSTHKRPILKTAYVEPSNDIEYKIAGIYQELLGIDRVGINDSFFDLGGNSLVGIQLISRLRQDFQIELSIPSLFQSPSVAELAFVIEEIIINELEKLTEDEVRELVPVNSII